MFGSLHTTSSDIELAQKVQENRVNGECAEGSANAQETIAKKGKELTDIREGENSNGDHDDEEVQEEEARVNDEKAVAELDDLNDVFLVMDGRRLAASKNVLCLASPVFKSMVESSMSHKHEIHLHGKKYSDVKEFYGCIDPRTMTPITDQNIYTVLPLLHEFKVECLLQRCRVFLPDKVNEFMDARELCRHLHLAVHYSLFDLEVKCVSLCSELKLAEMVEWMSYYNIPDPIQLKVRDKSLHRHELEESDMSIITQLYNHAKEETNKDFKTLLCEELKQNHFDEAFKEPSIKTSVTNHPCGTPTAFKPATNASSTSGFGTSNKPMFGAAQTSGFGAPQTSGFGVSNTSLFGAPQTFGFGAPQTPGFGAPQTSGFGASNTSSFGGFGTTAGFGVTRNNPETENSPGQLQVTRIVSSTTTTPSCSTTLGADSGTVKGFNFSKQAPEIETKILKFLQGMRLFYKYLEHTHIDMKRDVVQYMRRQMNKLSTREREIFDLLPARAKHDIRGRLVKEIPDKN